MIIAINRNTAISVTHIYAVKGLQHSQATCCLVVALLSLLCRIGQLGLATGLLRHWVGGGLTHPELCKLLQLA